MGRVLSRPRACHTPCSFFLPALLGDQTCSPLAGASSTRDVCELGVHPTERVVAGGWSRARHGPSGRRPMPLSSGAESTADQPVPERVRVDDAAEVRSRALLDLRPDRLAVAPPRQPTQAARRWRPRSPRSLGLGRCTPRQRSPYGANPAGTVAKASLPSADRRAGAAIAFPAARRFSPSDLAIEPSRRQPAVR